jgi:hypothetical protein
MPAEWPAISYGEWSATCDTLHAHTQVLGKLAVQLAPPEPQLQHAALHLSARGWETQPLPAPNGSGAIVAALDLHAHEAVVEHSDGRGKRIPLTPNRPVAEVTHDVLAAMTELGGDVEIFQKPQEVPWESPLDQDREHATYDPGQVESYFQAASQAALVLSDFRAAFRGRSSRVNAWWGTFDLAVHLFSGRPADPPADDFITRNGGDAEQIEIGWWPGDPNYESAAFYAFAFPSPEGIENGEVAPDAARWEPKLGEFVLDWEDVRASDDPHALGIEFAHSAFLYAAGVCEWDPPLAASAEGSPPPIH